jgi:hypothetical protein
MIAIQAEGSGTATLRLRAPGAARDLEVIVGDVPGTPSSVVSAPIVGLERQ